VQKQLVGDSPEVMTPQVILVAIGWEKVGDQEYRLDVIGSNVLQTGFGAYQLHLNADATLLQYVLSPYNVVERWGIQTGVMQDMSL
jgi:hypothetical protein